LNSLLRFSITNCIIGSSILLLLTSRHSFSQTWNPLSTGTNGVVYSTLVVPGTFNELYIGGSFTEAGGTPANRIAKWNGTSWQQVGGNGMDGTVYALAYFQEKVIAAGEFFTAGGTPANRIAKWTGTSWQPLNLGMNDNVYALAIYFNALRATGKFTTAGGILANRIASWDGNSWSAMGTGLNDEAYSLTVFGNDLVVGGKFTQAGGIPANRIAKWSDSWSPLGAGMDNGETRALSVFGGKLYAGGSFTLIGGVLVNYVARWDGSNWAALGYGTNNSVYSIYPSASVGGVLAVGGMFTNAGGIEANRVAVWDGIAWATLGTGMSGDSSSVRSFTDYAATLHAAGNFPNAGSQNVNNVALWGGLPTAPITVSPACGASGQSLTPLLDWSNVANTAYYSIQVASDPNFFNLVVDTTNLIQSQYQIRAGLLSNGETYYWHVRAHNGVGAGPYSAICWFSTLLVGLTSNENEIPERFELYQNFPNPFNPKTIIRYQLSVNSFVKLNVFDAGGKEVAILVNETLPAGTYQVEWDGTNFPSGIYFCQLLTTEFTEAKRMVLVK
jgi:hypothetical protein